MKTITIKEQLQELIYNGIIDVEHGMYDEVKNAIDSNDIDKMNIIKQELINADLI